MADGSPRDPFDSLSDANPYRDIGDNPHGKPRRPRDAAPNPALWLVYLFFMPRRFFTHFVVEHTPALTALCAWLLAIASSSTRTDSRLASATQHSVLASTISGWTIYWGLVGIASLLGLLLYFYIGGWWYRQRLRWSGVADPDKHLARRVYLYAAMVIALPMLFVKAWDTATFSTPMEAAVHLSVWKLLLLGVFPLWSVMTSYVGVRAAFDARGFGSVLWFVVLPGLIYGLVALGAVVMALAAVLGVGGLVTPSLPDVQNTKLFESDVFRFEYPGNWRIQPSDPAFDENQFVWVGPDSDSYTQFEVYRSTRSLSAELQSSKDGLADALACRVTGATPLNPWGQTLSHGEKFVLRSPFQFSYTCNVFLVQADDKTVLEIRELADSSYWSILEPGFELIESTFSYDAANAVQHAANLTADEPLVAPPVTTTRRFEGESFGFLYPSNWTFDADAAHLDDRYWIHVRGGTGVSLEASIEFLDSPALDRARETNRRIVANNDAAEIESVEVTHWGDRVAPGARTRVSIGESTFFIATYEVPIAPAYALEITEFRHESVADEAERAFRVIRDSLLIHSEAAISFMDAEFGRPLHTRPLDYRPVSPELSDPVVHANAWYRFEAPSNWIRWESVYDNDLESTTRLFPERMTKWPDASTMFRVLWYTSDRSIEAEMTATLRNWMGGSEALPVHVSSSKQWGALDGTGKEFELERQGGRVIRLRLFVHEHSDGSKLEILESCESRFCDQLNPGFEFIRGSFEIVQPSDDSAD